MSEMSAEKKKEIEKYIIKSYFGGGKNIESLANGADVIKGTDDGYIPQLIVEVTYFGESGIVMINWDIYDEAHDSEWTNSFAMRVCREREIEQNRCDSVDSMMYAWKSKILGKPIFLETNDEDLQKDKRIEELERTVKELRAEKEVMERHIQELESRNVDLAETNAVLKNSKDSYLRMVQTGAGYLKDWEEATGCSKPEHAKKKIYTLENECRVWHDTADHQLEQIHGLEDEVNKFYDMFDGCEPAYVKQRIDEMKDEIENLNKKLTKLDPMPEFKELLKKLHSTDDVEKLEWTINHTCGGRGSVNGWIAVSSFWKQNCEALLKLVGFSSIEEIQDYLTNEANCDTLHEAISNLHDEVKHTSNEWNEMDKKLKDCEKENGIYSRALNEWKEATGCPSPSAAKTMIECMASWHHAYDDAKKEIESLKEALRKSNSTMQKELDQEITKWQDATGRIEPEGAKRYIERLKDRINKIHDCAVDW